VDIHERASRLNVYGPVLFILDIETLKNMLTGRIWITKTNPTKWAGVSDDDRWFRSIGEIEKDFNYGTFEQMIVFRNCGGELPLVPALDEIILDDPEMRSRQSKVDLYSVAYGALQLAAFEGSLDVPIRRRECDGGCNCVESYAETPRRTLEKFAPKLPRA
jgi:hypothetical protein